MAQKDGEANMEEEEREENHITHQGSADRNGATNPPKRRKIDEGQYCCFGVISYVVWPRLSSMHNAGSDSDLSQILPSSLSND